MATLEKIRNRSGLLVGILAVALALFVLQSALESGNSFFMGDRSIVGVIDDRKVKIEEFQNKVDQAVESEKSRSGKVDESTTDMLRQQAWNQMVFETVMNKQHEKLGVAVSTDELYDMIQGPNPHPWIKQNFTDQKTGQFNSANVINFLKRMDEDQTGETRQRWMQFETGMKADRINTKFNNLVKKGLYVTKSQAKNDYLAASESRKFKYVLKRYDSVADSTGKVTEDDIEKYYNKNKNKYKQERSRTVEFVSFDVVPSEEDSKTTEEWITKVKGEFETTKEDSIFVAANSDSKMVPTLYKKGAMRPDIDSVLFNSPIGTVYGPYMEGDFFKLAKVVDIKSVPDSVKARHILIKTEGGDNKKALAKADSLKKLIKAGKKFDELAREVSEDVGSAVKGGDLGWYKEGQMVPSFNDATFFGKKGDMPIVESQFGVHLIEILDKGAESNRVKVAILDRKIEPSSKTYQVYYSKASEFAGKNTTSSTFSQSIIDQGLNKRIAENIKETDRNLPGIEGARELVRWAYTAEEGSVSKVFELGDKYVIAHLKDVKEKGIAPLKQVEETVTKEAIKEKKAENFIASISSSISGVTTVDQIAAKLQLPAQSIESQSYASSTIPGVSREPQVVGILFALAKNKISEPIKGETGVWVIQVEDIKAAPATKEFPKDQTTSQLSNRVDYEMFEALKEKVEIVDNRGKFF